MGAAIPITNAGIGGFRRPVTPTAQPAAPAAGPVTAASDVAAVQGTGPLSGLHNTPLHVSCILLAALGIIVVFNLAGFRFATDVSVGLGK